MKDKFTLLLVDDSTSRRLSLRTLLASLPECEIVAAESGGAALLYTLEHPVHLILLQVEMLEMDGFDTARHLQMTEHTRAIPVIFVTATYTMASFRQHGYALGDVDCIVQPVDPHLLISRIQIYRRLHQRRCRLYAVLDTQRQNEISLAKARECAAAANRSKSLFLATMSDEIRTPMNAIIDYTQLLQHCKRLSLAQRGHVATIRSSGEHLLGIINDILDISLIESGRSHLHLAVFDLHDLIAAVRQMCRLLADAKSLSFSLDIDAAVPRFIEADPTKVRQVLINLIGNALKFTSTGAVIILVGASSRETGWLISIDIHDTGPGIDAADHELIFAPFVQVTGRPVGAKGTGLGLSIARNHARLMGGDITCKSHIGFGADFHFSFLANLADEPISSGDLPS